MNNSAGYTLAELVVTIVLLGTLTAVAVPTYNKVINKAQKQVNLSDMETIKNTFMQYFYVTHMQGNPHFPPEPENSLLDSTYREITLEDGRTPDNLFSLYSASEVLTISLGSTFNILRMFFNSSKSKGSFKYSMIL